MEDRKEVIKCFEERLRYLPDGQKIKLSNEEILKYFFVENKNRNYYTPMYSQCVAEKFLQKIYLNEFFDEYSDSISMLLGADLAGTKFKYKDIGFIELKNLFLNPHKYTGRYLGEIDAINRLQTLPMTNLSDIDLSGSEWNLELFLGDLIDNLATYVKEKYKEELHQENKIWKQIEETPYILQFLDFDPNETSEKVTDDVIKLAKKLIPNLKNTKLKIMYRGSRMSSIDYDIINYALENGYFDGCNLQIHSDTISTSYSDELYYHDKTKSKKR